MASASGSSIKTAQLLLRLGIAFVFLYAAIAALVTPSDWIGYLPHFAKQIVSGGALLKVISVYQIMLAVWLLWGRYLKLAAALSAATFLGITLSNLNIFTVTFRDIGLLAMALALYFTD